MGVTGDAAGNVWVLSGRQIMQWDGARFRPLQGLTLPFYRSEWNPHVWWASDRGRLHRFAAGEVSVRQIPSALQGLSNNQFEEDGAGTLWMGTLGRRVARITDGAIRFDEIPDLQSEDSKLQSMYKDSSGHQWAFTVSRRLVRFWSVPQSRDTPIAVNAVLEDQEINVFRIVQESLNNIVKHSGASRASIDVAHDGTDLVITIADNGKGFDAKAARAATIGSGFGLAGVGERVGMLGGRHSMVSAPGQGTTVTIVLPGPSGQDHAG